MPVVGLLANSIEDTMSAELIGVSAANWDQIIPYGNQDMNLTLGPDGGSCTRSYLVPWGIWQTVAMQFIGYPYMVGTTMNRHLPQTIEFLVESFPPAPPITGAGGGAEAGVQFKGFMYASDLRIQPRGGQGFKTVNTVLLEFDQLYRDWDYALFEVTYKTCAYDIWSLQDIANGYGVFPSGPPEANRYVDWQDDDGMKTAQVDREQWVNYSLAIAAAPGTPGNQKFQSCGNKLGLPYAEGRVTMTWFDVDPSGFNEAYANSILGTTNNAQFFNYTSFNYFQTGNPASGSPGGQLIYTGYKKRRRRGPLGNRTLNIEFSFIKRPFGANVFLRNDGTYGTVFGTPLSTTPFVFNPVQPIAFANFNNLFVAPATPPTGGDF
jgi:hypothetical protein